MSLKYETFLELPVKQFVIQSIQFIWSSENLWCEKNQTLVLLVAKLARYFSY